MTMIGEITCTKAGSNMPQVAGKIDLQTCHLQEINMYIRAF